MILVRTPALEAALARFDAWWSTLSQRERVLISVLGALVAIAVLVFGVVKPLQAARAQALADIRTHETLTARIRAAGVLTAPTTAKRQGPVQKVVEESASSFGLVVTVQPMVDETAAIGSNAAPISRAGYVQATIADASYDSLLAWLADLSVSSDVRLRGLSIQRRPSPGRVSATVDFGA